MARLFIEPGSRTGSRVRLRSRWPSIDVVVRARHGFAFNGSSTVRWLPTRRARTSRWQRAAGASWHLYRFPHFLCAGKEHFGWLL